MGGSMAYMLPPYARVVHFLGAGCRGVVSATRMSEALLVFGFAVRVHRSGCLHAQL